MRYTNAKIKSKEELYHRLLNGEVFYTLKGIDLVKAFYDSEYIEPFRIKYVNDTSEDSFLLRSLANNYDNFCIEDPIQWWELPLPKEGVLVYAKGNTNNPRLIISIDHDIATTAMGTKLNIHDLVLITPNDPRLFKEKI